MKKLTEPIKTTELARRLKLQTRFCLEKLDRGLRIFWRRCSIFFAKPHVSLDQLELDVFIYTHITNLSRFVSIFP